MPCLAHPVLLVLVLAVAVSPDPPARGAEPPKAAPAQMTSVQAAMKVHLAGDPKTALPMYRRVLQAMPAGADAGGVRFAIAECLAETDRAREAVANGMPPLARRLEGLVGTPYARMFLTELPHNAGLLAAAARFSLVPEKIHRVLERGVP